MSAYCKAISVVAEYDVPPPPRWAPIRGSAGLLLKASDALRKRYLPEVASNKVACYALTESQAGSDVKALTSRVEHSGDGVLHLTGSKLWITNGGFAKYATVFARETLANGKEAISAFWVDLDWPGVTRGAEEQKMGLTWSSTVALFFDRTPVPTDHRIGAPATQSACHGDSQRRKISWRRAVPEACAACSARRLLMRVAQGLWP